MLDYNDHFEQAFRDLKDRMEQAHALMAVSRLSRACI